MDLFRLPWLGPLARWRHTRRLLQSVLLLVAAVLVVHGLTGPQIAPRNAATVFTWVHYRGLIVVALLAVGNLFCTACPMILVRDAGRRLAHPALRWPLRLRGKWLAAILFAAVLFSYELFDLWELPRATAWLILGYFGAALVVDVLFAGATFCKYLCPVGQFNFVGSLMSPTELQVRDMGTCRACRTSDCIKGRPRAAPAGAGRQAAASTAGRVQTSGHLRGCELGLFLPLKVGNMDCTLCLDCVRACPHDNIGLMTRIPGSELLDTRRRSGVGRLAQRPDLAALVILFTFGALLNAFAMTAPVRAIERGLAQIMGTTSEAPVLGSLFLLALVAVPLVLLATAAQASRLLIGAGRLPFGATIVRHVYALVPLGAGIWVAHYGFHFLTGALTVVPVAQAATIDLLGRAVLGEPRWTWVGLAPGSVFPIQLGFLLLGAAGSGALTCAIALRDHPDRMWRASMPWLALILGLSAAAIWIVAQPMDMRGVGFAG